MEILFVILLGLSGILLLKLFVFFIKTGIFLITLPIKIALAVLFSLLLLILLPVFVLPVLFTILLPLIPLLMIALGIFLLIKYAF